MLTLGIETSQVPGSIALSLDGRCLEERTLQPGRRHAETLIPEISRLLADFGYAPQDCEAVAVSEGPGSFTGLRIGVTCAKTLAYATGARLAAVSTLQAVAENASPEIEQLFVISDAQRQQLFVNEYSRSAETEWQSVAEMTIVDAESWSFQRDATESVTGPALTKFQNLFTDRCHLLPEETWAPRASVIARLGEKNIAEDRAADIWSLQPLYVRKSAAEERADSQRAAKE